MVLIIKTKGNGCLWANNLFLFFYNVKLLKSLQYNHTKCFSYQMYFMQHVIRCIIYTRLLLINMNHISTQNGIIIIILNELT